MSTLSQCYPVNENSLSPGWNRTRNSTLISRIQCPILWQDVTVIFPLLRHNIWLGTTWQTKSTSLTRAFLVKMPIFRPLKKFVFYGTQRYVTLNTKVCYPEHEDMLPWTQSTRHALLNKVLCSTLLVTWVPDNGSCKKLHLSMQIWKRDTKIPNLSLLSANPESSMEEA